MTLPEALNRRYDEVKGGWPEIAAEITPRKRRVSANTVRRWANRESEPDGLYIDVAEKWRRQRVALWEGAAK